MNQDWENQNLIYFIYTTIYIEIMYRVLYRPQDHTLDYEFVYLVNLI